MSKMYSFGTLELQENRRDTPPNAQNLEILQSVVRHLAVNRTASHANSGQLFTYFVSVTTLNCVDPAPPDPVDTQAVVVERRGVRDGAPSI